MKYIIKKIIFLGLFPILIGIVSSFSLPPYDFYFINFFTYPILFLVLISINKDKKLISFIFGWMFGFGYFLSSLYWIANALTFDEIFKPLIPLAVIIIPLFLGIFYGFATFFASIFKLKKNISSILLFSLTVAIIEFVRGYVLGGFPWNLIVYSLTNYLYSIQILSFIGTYSLNLLLLTIYIFPACLFFKKSIKSRLLIISLLLIVILINNFYGLWNIKNFNQTEKEKINYKIKIVNPNITIDRFFVSEDVKPIIDEIITLSNPKISEKSLYVFPEGVFSNIYFKDLQYYRKLFLENFSDQDVIVMGMNTQKYEDGNNKIYNSLIVADNNLNILSKYDKIKLVPFGEFLPFENVVSKFGLKKITQGYQSFSRSEYNRETIRLDSNNFNFIPLICYEIIYSGKINTSDKKSDFIINISEDGWFGNSIGLEQHFSHAIFRSVEEGKNLIRSSNNGISAYINPIGQVIKKLKSTKKGMIEIDNFQKTKNTFFGTYGNEIFIYIIFFYIILIFLIKLIESRSSNEKRLFVHK